MQIIFLLIALAAMALGGAAYYRNEMAVTNDGAQTTEVTTSSSDITNILDDAHDAADAMSGGLGSNTETTAPTPTTPTTAATHTYADGTYTKAGTYRSPEGRENVSLTLTLKDDVVTKSSFTATSDEDTSQRYMDRFSSGYSSLVVGKAIDSIKLTVVNGSSLTPKGFMDALAQIKTEAKI